MWILTKKNLIFFNEKKKKKQNAVCGILRGKAPINFLWVPKYVNAQWGKGLKKELKLEEAI